MAKRSAAAAWGRLLGKISRQQLAAGQRAARRALAQSVKAAKAARPATVAKVAKKVKAVTPLKTALAVKPARPRAPSPAAPRRAPEAAMLAGVAVGNGGSRRWWLHRPRGLAPGARPPLLVLLHGCDQDAAGFAALTRMNRLADQQGFMVLHLEQDRLANGQRCWNWFDTRRGRAQAEAALVLQAVDQVVQRHRADAGRVALVGLSAGASLAALLALRHPERFAAVVMHSGVPPGQAHSTLSALAAMRGRALREAAERVAGAPALPALLVIHGDADTVVSPRNGQQAVLDWAAAAGARASPPRTVQRGQRHALTLTDHRVGRRLVAQLALVSGLGHAWSGGAPGLRYSDPRGPDASRLAWAFIHRQFSARTRAAAPA